MYVKYVVDGGNLYQRTTDLINVINGTYTSVSDFLYAGSGSEISGTAPTAGIYHTFVEIPGTTIGSWTFKKNHAQYETGVFEPTMSIRLGATSGNQLSIGFADKNQTNGNTWSSLLNGNDTRSTPGIGVGSEIHMIINDTTIVLWTSDPYNINPDVRLFGMNMWSDFKKTPYDNYAIGLNDKYYPGASMTTNQNGGLENNYITYASVTMYVFGCYRFQYQTPNGTFRNSTSVLTHTNPPHYYPTAPNSNPDGTTYPSPFLRIPSAPGDAGGPAVMFPLLYSAFSLATHAYNIPETDFSTDVRLINQFANSYRTADGIGLTGDIIQVDSNNYRVFRGQKVGNTGQNLSYQTACYAFPEDNVVI